MNDTMEIVRLLAKQSEPAATVDCDVTARVLERIRVGTGAGRIERRAYWAIGTTTVAAILLTIGLCVSRWQRDPRDTGATSPMAVMYSSLADQSELNNVFEGMTR